MVLTEKCAYFVVHLLTNLSPEIQAGLFLYVGGIAALLSRKPEYVERPAPCSSASSHSCGFPAQFLAAAAGMENFSLFLFPPAPQLLGRWGCGIQSEGHMHTKIISCRVREVWNKLAA